MGTVKDAIGQATDRLGDEIEALSHKIHAHPELAYQEVQACGWLCDFLGAKGFKVERGVAGVDTAFRATIETGTGRPSPSSASTTRCPPSGTRAGTTSSPRPAREPARRWPPCATRCRRTDPVIGTPAEEGGGGKVQADPGRRVQVRGRRDDGPWLRPADRRTRICSASCGSGFEFTGKAAHASVDPWEGVNALDAVIQTFNNVSMLRQQMRPDARIHGIVTNGGRRRTSSRRPPPPSSTCAPRDREHMWDSTRACWRARRAPRRLRA